MHCDTPGALGSRFNIRGWQVRVDIVSCIGISKSTRICARHIQRQNDVQYLSSV